MANLRLKEVANEATNKDFYNQFFTSSKVTNTIGFFGQFISSLTEFHFIFSALSGAYKPFFTISNILPFLAGLVAIYIFEVVGVRVFLVRIIRQIVNLDFLGSERKTLFVFNLIFVFVLCGSNLLLSVLGQKYSFSSKTNVTTTDKTYKLSNEKSTKIQSTNLHFDGLQSDLLSNYENSKTSVINTFDNDVKLLKENQKKFKDLDWKFNEYTLKIDSKGEAKTSDLSGLLSTFNIDKEQLRNDQKTQINSITANFESRINDVSKTENSNVDMWLMVEKYTLPILIIFILLSWVAIVYNEIFLKGAGQTIEIKEVAKKPLLIVIFLAGIYEKFYQIFYWLVAKIIGSKKYQFGDIQQDVVKYQIKQKQQNENTINVAAQVREIGFNRNNQNNQNNNQNNNKNGLPKNDLSGSNTNDLSDSKSMNYSNYENRITKVVAVQKSDTNSNKRMCKNCNESYVYKHHKQMYCTTECRIKNWELRTGRKMTKKPKK
jgi:hypothetical protein